MVAIIASATSLPFPDGSFDVAIASDVLEHVPSVARENVIREACRVARKLVVFAFPCGKNAHETDRALFESYLREQLEPPVWLKEHMLEDFPDTNLFTGFPDWEVTELGNESIRFHFWMMRMEMHRMFNYAARAYLRYAPRFIESLLRRVDRAPYYRRIFVLRRKESSKSVRYTVNQAQS